MLKHCYLIALLTCGCLFPAHGQMYRCGNQYQDRPCAGSAGKQISATPNGPSTAERPFTAFNCAQRGQAAKAIAERRAGGATIDQLLLEIDQKPTNEQNKNAEKSLVMSVSQLDSSPEHVATIVETQCSGQKRYAEQMKKNRDAEIAAAEEAARYSSSSSSGSSNSQASRLNECEKIAKALDENTEDRRRGGSGSTMNYYEDKRRQLYDRQSKAGC